MPKHILFIIVLCIQSSSSLFSADTVNSAIEKKYQRLIDQEDNFKQQLIGKMHASLTTFYPTKEFPVPFNSIQGYFNHFIKNQPKEAQFQFKKDIVDFAKQIAIVCTDEAMKKAADFLEQKKKSPLNIEHDVYAFMNLAQFIFRLFNNRPLTYYGQRDNTLLLGKEDYYPSAYLQHLDIGTNEEKAPFILADLLSYEEREISELFGIGCPTFFINKGNRDNKGSLTNDDYQERGIYVGLVGPCYEKAGQMACKSLIRSTDKKDGDIELKSNNLKITTSLKGEYDKAESENKPTLNLWFRPSTHKARIKLSIEAFLHFANEKAQCMNKKAYLHIVGLGLGAWGLFRDSAATDFPLLTTNTADPSHHIEMKIMLKTYKELLEQNEFEYIDTVNFSHIYGNHIYAAALFHANSQDLTSLYECAKENHKTEKHAEELRQEIRQGRTHIKKNDRAIKIIFSQRSVADKLTDEDKDKLLIAMYPWDGCSYPGNEYWMHNVAGSGDPAAASCSLIPSLQNPRINKRNIVKNINTLVKNFIAKHPEYKHLMGQKEIRFQGLYFFLALFLYHSLYHYLASHFFNH